MNCEWALHISSASWRSTKREKSPPALAWSMWSCPRIVTRKRSSFGHSEPLTPVNSDQLSPKACCPLPMQNGQQAGIIVGPGVDFGVQLGLMGLVEDLRRVE